MRRRSRHVRQFTDRDIARIFRVPDHVLGLPSPWYRRLWQRLTRRP